MSLTSAAIVAAIAFLAPLAIRFTRVRLCPSIVLEIMLGICIGPQVLGWAAVDQPVAVLKSADRSCVPPAPRRPRRSTLSAPTL